MPAVPADRAAAGERRSPAPSRMGQGCCGSVRLRRWREQTAANPRAGACRLRRFGRRRRTGSAGTHPEVETLENPICCRARIAILQSQPPVKQMVCTRAKSPMVTGQRLKALAFTFFKGSSLLPLPLLPPLKGRSYYLPPLKGSSYSRTLTLSIAISRFS